MHRYLGPFGLKAPGGLLQCGVGSGILIARAVRVGSVASVVRILCCPLKVGALYPYLNPE